MRAAPPRRHHSPRTLAAAGFLFHAPALYVLGYRMNRPTIVRNAFAIGATILSTAATYAALPAGDRFVPCLVVWFTGHFAWSGYLAWAVVTGRAGTLGR